MHIFSFFNHFFIDVPDKQKFPPSLHIAFILFFST